ncbi:MAG: hypothetical protein WC473_02670 [Patescibacteria group bacterium]
MDKKGRKGEGRKREWISAKRKNKRPKPKHPAAAMKKAKRYQPR